VGSFKTGTLNAQKVEYLKVPDLEKILNNPTNKLFVINLWATWCAPCVKELPDFEKVAKEYDASKVKFILISLDFPSEVDKQLLPFLKRNNISMDVALMTDTDYDSWVRKVDKDWQGNIPSTLLFNNSKKARYFHSGEISESELRNLITRYL
jgi:thiol-disulfide isomerase/thioredoxin